MKFFKVLSMILIVCVVLFFAIGIFLPKTATIERHYEFHTPAWFLQDELLELYDNHIWPIWRTEDTTITFTPHNNGGGYSWEGQNVGYGEVDYSIGVDFTIHDNISFRGRDIAETIWRFDGADPVNLHLTFTVYAGRNLSARWTNLFLDRMVGTEIDRIMEGVRQRLEHEGLIRDTP